MDNGLTILLIIKRLWCMYPLSIFVYLVARKQVCKSPLRYKTCTNLCVFLKRTLRRTGHLEERGVFLEKNT
jgi:hypothetical protein